MFWETSTGRGTWYRSPLWPHVHCTPIMSVSHVTENALAKATRDFPSAELSNPMDTPHFYLTGALWAWDIKLPGTVPLSGFCDTAPSYFPHYLSDCSFSVSFAYFSAGQFLTLGVPGGDIRPVPLPWPFLSANIWQALLPVLILVSHFQFRSAPEWCFRNANVIRLFSHLKSFKGCPPRLW